MTPIKYLGASGALALSLLAASPASADSAQLSVNGGLQLGVRLAPIVRVLNDYKVDVKNDLKHNVDKFNNDTVGSTSLSVGSVASVNGSTFVVSPAKSGKPTTTVVTDSSTVFKINGVATTSAAIQPGERVFVVGTTTATSTSGNTVDASLVIVWNKMLGFCKHFLGIK